MQIISGSLKGRRIKFPKHIRPTQNKIRKAVFDCLGDCVGGSVFLELFAGSGAVGIEAFSYGAKEVSFVDNNRDCLNVIEFNLKLLGITKYKLYYKDSLEVLGYFSGKGLKFDIVFLDPPYLRDLAKKTLRGVSACDIVPPSGIVILEHHKKEELPAEEGSLILFKQKRYSDTVVSFYKGR